MVAKADMSKPNTEKGVVLLMNLAADAQNRRAIREAGGVEALVKVMSASALDTTMESVIGALHNVLLSDGKGKQRAMDAGIAVPLARILAARLSESSLIAVRVRMLVSDLLRVPDIQERIRAAAEEKGFTLPVRVRMLVSDLLRVPGIQERIRAAAEEKGSTLPGTGPFGMG
eukprot:gene17962-24367_t